MKKRFTKNDKYIEIGFKTQVCFIFPKRNLYIYTYEHLIEISKIILWSIPFSSRQNGKNVKGIECNVNNIHKWHVTTLNIFGLCSNQMFFINNSSLIDIDINLLIFDNNYSYVRRHHKSKFMVYLKNYFDKNVNIHNYLRKTCFIYYMFNALQKEIF